MIPSRWIRSRKTGGRRYRGGLALLLLALPISVAPLGAQASPTAEKAGAEIGADFERLPGEGRYRTLRDDAAREALEGERAELLERLREETNSRVELTLDAESGAVLLIKLLGDEPRLWENRDEAARELVERFGALFDPESGPWEAAVAEQPLGYYGFTTVVYRSVGGVPVLGSRVTVHFSPAGAMERVTYGVAAAPEPREGGFLGEIPPEAVRRPFFIPGERRDELVDAEIVVLPDHERPERFTAVLARDGAVVAGPHVMTDWGVPPGLPGTPSYHLDSRTRLPDLISYRSFGGVPAPLWVRQMNPGEIAYRFLEHHPALFRTGAPRRQYRVQAITDSPLLPGVQFVRLEQRYEGLPVFGAELVFEIYDLRLVASIAGHVLPEINLDPQPRISPETAVRSAENLLIALLEESGRNGEVAWVPPAGTPELGVFPGTLASDGSQPVRLAFRVPLPPYVYYIDASNGAELYHHSTRTFQSVNDGLGLDPGQRNRYVEVLSDGVPTGATGPNGLPLPLNADVLPTHRAANRTSTFLASLGWLGIDNRGGRYVLNTNVTSTLCPNAWYSPNNGEVWICLGLAAGDVLAHELSHAVVHHSSGLVYRDQSGALDESLADLLGNLVFPDAVLPGTPPSWLMGEDLPAGPSRDMRFPAVAPFLQPDHMRDLRVRGAGCTSRFSDCDNGFVHTNSGITNRAWVLLSDGIPGMTAGIGREKLAVLAFLTMTQRLTPFSTLNDAALLTQDMGDSLVARRATDRQGVAFVQNDVDAVFLAFDQVGLGPGLSRGWSEPAVGFSGTELFFISGERTASGCNVENVRASLHTPAGDRTIDLDPRTPMPNAAAFGVYGIDFTQTPPGTTPPPLGTPLKRHALNWFSIFGLRPFFQTQVIPAPPPAGALNCVSPAGFQPISRTSPTVALTGLLFGGAGTAVAGNPASSMNPACRLRTTEVEILDAAGNRLAGPAVSCTYTNILWFIVPIHLNRTATMVRPPFGLPDLSAPVRWNYDVGQEIRFRLRYTIDQPAGQTCVP